MGYEAMYSNTTGFDGVAIGTHALRSNISGDFNTAIGKDALYSVYSGNLNVAVGLNAGENQSTGDLCTFVGYSAEGATGSYTNAMALGNAATAGASNEVRIGNSAITEIGGFEPWTNVSDGRYKKNVREDVEGLSFILKLRPVTYNLEVNKLSQLLKEDEHLDDNGNLVHITTDPVTQESRNKKEQITYSGFIAQEVEHASTTVGYDFSGVKTPANDEDLYGLSYAEFVVPLVKLCRNSRK